MSTIIAINLLIFFMLQSMERKIEMVTENLKGRRKERKSRKNKRREL